MSGLAGARTLLRFAARRERLRIPLYLAIFVALIVSTAVQSEGLYATQAERDEYAATVAGNPGLIAMVGPAYAVDTVGGDVAWQWGAFGGAIAALMSMFIVGRHTRAEEESGRSELIRAGVVGRYAPAAAALAVVVAANVLMGALVAVSMIALGHAAAGSLALGASLAGVGLCFAGVALLAAQLAHGTGGAYGLVGAALGFAYMLRAAGDVGDGTLSWLSPLGWGQAMRPFAGERWWPLLLLVGAGAALTVAAFAALTRRDEGAGALADRPGSPTASRRLTGPLGLPVRLGRGAFLGWAAGLFAYGISIGLTAQDADSILGDSEAVDDLFGRAGGTAADGYIAVSLSWLALIGTGFAVQTILRMRSEETGGRLEPVLAGALSRVRWAAGHVATAALGAILVLAAAGLGTGVADALAADDAGRVGTDLGAALVAVPAVWVVMAVAVALFGLVPRASAAAWGVLGACFTLGIVGPLLSLPDAVLDLSPFEHVPLLPVADLTLGPLAALTAVAAALTAVGLAAFRRRDVPA